MRRLLFVLPLLLGGCSHRLSPIAAQAVLEQPPSTVPVPAEEVNGFVFHTVRNVVPENEKGNVLLAPLSVHFALSMLATCNTGRERTELLKAMGATQRDFEGGDQSLMQALMRSTDVDLAIANSLWYVGSAVSRNDQQRLRRIYGAELFRVDDLSQPQALMNDWIRRNTRDRIEPFATVPTIAQPQVLVDAVAFDAKWETEFDSSKTKDAPFRLASGTTASVPMMVSSEHASVFGSMLSDGSGSATIPYRGGEFELTAVLPPKGVKVAPYLRSLTAKEVKRLLDEQAPGRVVYLPRVRIEKRYDLAKSLPAGMAKTVQGTHATMIEWDEQGTRAAAGTSISCAKPADTLGPIVLDHPFVFLLRHRPTGVILFVGLYQGPESATSLSS